MIRTKTHIVQVLKPSLVGLWLAIAAILPLIAGGQGSSLPEYQVKAVFLYNFTRFIEWPESAYSSPNAPFIIGVLGNDPFGKYLEEAVAGERINTRPIIIKKMKDSKEAGNCQVLFIASSDPAIVKPALVAASGKSILTVSDDPDFTRKGGIINFFIENNKVRFQVNSSAAKNAGLSISSKLLNVAKVQ